MRAGSLDASFGTAGVARATVGGDGWATGAVGVRGGAIVVAGTRNPVDRVKYSDIAVTRFTAAGAPDPSFGAGGQTTLPSDSPLIGRAHPSGEATAVAAQQDGKLVLATWTPAGMSSDHDVACYRLTADGAPDVSFGVFGATIVGVGGDDIATAVAVQPDGKIVIAGWTRPKSAGQPEQQRPRDFAVVRLNQDGSVDTGFRDHGIGVYGLGGDDWATGIAVAPDGKIVVAGWTLPAGAQSRDFAVLRLLPDGAPDVGFGSLGASVVGLGGNDTATAVAIQPDGKIVVAGVTEPEGSDLGDVAVLRLTPDGGLDTGFGGNGTSIHGVGGDDWASCVAIQPNGQIVVGGTSLPSGAATRNAVAVRLNPDGSLDTGFGRNGAAVHDLGGDDWISGLVLQPDGAIVLTGWTLRGVEREFAALRLFGASGLGDVVVRDPPHL